MRLLCSLLLVVFLAACASSHIITGKTRPPIPPEQVRIYSAPPSGFEEIALIESSSRGSFSISDQGKTDTVIERLKEEAGKLGANGVLLELTGSESSGGVMTGVSSGGANARYGTGIYTQALHKVGKGRAIYVRE